MAWEYPGMWKVALAALVVALNKDWQPTVTEAS